MATHKLETHKPKYKQPWFIRRVVYVVVAVVALIANYFFDIPVAQTNTWYPAVESVVEFVAPLLLFYAATKANPGSDANVTEEDLTDAQVNVIEARERVERAKETETVLDDIASRLNLSVVTVSNLIEEVRSANAERPAVNVPHEVGQEDYDGPIDSGPPVELSLDSLRDRLSGSR